jgi:hypothetical protein
VVSPKNVLSPPLSADIISIVIALFERPEEALTGSGSFAECFRRFEPVQGEGISGSFHDFRRE